MKNFIYSFIIVVSFLSSEYLFGCEGRNLKKDGKILVCNNNTTSVECWTENKAFYDSYSDKGYCEVPPVAGEVKSLSYKGWRSKAWKSPEKLSAFGCFVDDEGVKCFGEKTIVDAIVADEKIDLIKLDKPQYVDINLFPVFRDRDKNYIYHSKAESSVCVGNKSTLKCISIASLIYSRGNKKVISYNIPKSKKLKFLPSMNRLVCTHHDSEVTCYRTDKKLNYAGDILFAPQSFLNVKNLDIKMEHGHIIINAEDGNDKFTRKFFRKIVLPLPPRVLWQPDQTGITFGLEKGLIVSDKSKGNLTEISLISSSTDAFHEVRDFYEYNKSDKIYSCGLVDIEGTSEWDSDWACWGKEASRVPTTSGSDGPVLGYFYDDHNLCWYKERARKKWSCKDLRDNSTNGSYFKDLVQFLPQNITSLSKSHKSFSGISTREICFHDKKKKIEREICWNKKYVGTPIHGKKSHSISIKILKPELSRFHQVVGNKASGCGEFEGLHCWGEDMISFSRFFYKYDKNYLLSRLHRKGYKDFLSFDGHFCLIFDDDEFECMGHYGYLIDRMKPSSTDQVIAVDLLELDYCSLINGKIKCFYHDEPDLSDYSNLDFLSGVKSLRSDGNNICALQLKNEIKRELCWNRSTVSSVKLISPLEREFDDIVESNTGGFKCGSYKGKYTCWGSGRGNSLRTSKDIPFFADSLFSNLTIIPYSLLIEEDRPYGDKYAHSLCFYGMSKDFMNTGYECRYNYRHIPHIDPVKNNFGFRMNSLKNDYCYFYDLADLKLKSCSHKIESEIIPLNGIVSVLNFDKEFLYRHDKILVEQLIPMTKGDYRKKHNLNILLELHRGMKKSMSIVDEGKYKLIFDENLSLEIPAANHFLPKFVREEQTLSTKVLLSVIRTSLSLLSDIEKNEAIDLMKILTDAISQNKILSENTFTKLRDYLAICNGHSYLNTRVDLLEYLINGLDSNRGVRL